jgi:hypothetical protein
VALQCRDKSFPNPETNKPGEQSLEEGNANDEVVMLVAEMFVAEMLDAEKFVAKKLFTERVVPGGCVIV